MSVKLWYCFNLFCVDFTRLSYHLPIVMQNLIPVGTAQTRKVALLPENKARNRFSNVLPCKLVL